MATKIKYRVVHCTSFEPAYPATELENQSQQTKGWQSAKFCPFPQEIVISFDRLYDIAQIQILSHQSKIASKVEIFVGILPTGVMASTLQWQDADYKRLGYLSLDPNERSGWKARELKSVFVETRGSFLKLVIHKNHPNALNLFSQVGFVAVNILGSPHAGEASLMAPASLPASAPMARDDSSDASLDAVTAKQIRELNMAKIRAVEAENYDEAKRLKEAIDNLKKVGSDLAKLEAAKKQAVIQEDYDRAKELKLQIDRLRTMVLDPLNPKLAAPAKIDDRPAFAAQPVAAMHSAMEEPVAQRVPRGRVAPVAAAAPVDMDREEDFLVEHVAPQPVNRDERPIRPAKSLALSEEVEQPVAASSPPPPPPQPKKKAVPRADAVIERAPVVRDEIDRPIAPAKVSADSASAEQEEDPAEQDDGSNAGGAVGDPEQLSAADRKDAEFLLEVMDEMVVRGLYSKSWSHREHAAKTLLSLMPQLNADGNVGPRNMFRVLVPLLKRLLNDKVPQVYLHATEIFQNLVHEFAVDLRKDEIHKSIEVLMPVLIKRVDDANARVRTSALKTCVVLALDRAKLGFSLVGPLLLKPLKSAAAATPFESRASFLKEVIPALGINDKSGLSLDSVMTFILAALQHKSGAVRESGVTLATQVYQAVGKKITPYFADLKPALLDLLNQAFENVGGDVNEPLVAAPPKRTAAPNGGASSVKSPQPAAKGGKVQNSPAAKNNPKGKAAPKVQEEVGECDFCGFASPSMLDEHESDLHYYNDCPFLSPCPQCDQVVDIPALNDHLISECNGNENFPERKQKYVACPTCLQAIPEVNLAAHQSAAACKPAQPAEVASRCPLCLKDVAPGPDGLKNHILSGKGCSGNPRKLLR